MFNKIMYPSRYFCFALLLLLLSDAATSNNFGTLQLSSLLPHHQTSTAHCNNNSPQSEGLDGGAGSLKVVHRYNPCAATHGSARPTLTQILTQDKLRLRSLRARVSKVQRLSQDDAGANLPAESGGHFYSGGYVVYVHIGSPLKTLLLMFDTGSDLTWTQCSPCAKYCYPQKLHIFDPRKSTTYSHISCSSTLCSDLKSYTGFKGNICSNSSTCVYGIGYGDKSFSVGYLAKDRLSLTGSDVVDNFMFGCGQYNNVTFREFSGLLGLGSGEFSIVSQTAEKYGKIFSYCLPTVNGNGGYLKFGRGAGKNKNVSFTPFVNTGNGTSFYYIQVLSIRVAGKKLPIRPVVFRNAGMIIDSGTTLTYLPPKAYDALKTAFVKEMKLKNYTKTQKVAPPLDTCYDFSGRAGKNTTIDHIKLPSIVFEFSNNVNLRVPDKGILFVANNTLSQVCLAFARNQNSTDFGVYGYLHQQTVDVVYDVANGNLGFGPGHCT